MRYTRWILAGVLAAVWMVCQPYAAMGGVQDRAETATTITEQADVCPEELTPDNKDPDYVKRQLLDQAQLEDVQQQSFIRKTSASNKNKVRSPFTGLTYTYAKRLQGYDVVHGIDVSKWQGTIDWAKVKKSGVTYAFIRCGYTELASKFKTHEDVCFRRNIVEARKQGIRVGVYYFSNARTVSEAKKEAKRTLKYLKGYEKYVSMPIVYDFEAFNKSYRAYGLSKKRITDQALAFFKIVKKAGFSGMYYGSANYIAKNFDVKRLSGYPCWLARYGTTSDYAGSYKFWQYSSSGHVKGVKGNCDCNFWFVKNAKNVIDRDTGQEDVTEPGDARTQPGNTGAGTEESGAAGTDKTAVSQPEVSGTGESAVTQPEGSSTGESATTQPEDSDTGESAATRPENSVPGVATNTEETGTAKQSPSEEAGDAQIGDTGSGDLPEMNIWA